MKLESSAFKQGQKIPVKYTCEGENVSPPLTIINIPPRTVSLALILDDPDAPHGTFDHWIAWNILPAQTVIGEGASLPVLGLNGYRETNYKGPCPPAGKLHHYHFRVYALSKKLEIPAGSTKQQLELAIQGHILEKAELVGTYQR